MTTEWQQILLIVLIFSYSKKDMIEERIADYSTALCIDILSRVRAIPSFVSPCFSAY